MLYHQCNFAYKPSALYTRTHVWVCVCVCVCVRARTLARSFYVIVSLVKLSELYKPYSFKTKYVCLE